MGKLKFTTADANDLLSRIQVISYGSESVELNTIVKLANSINNDPNFYHTISTQIIDINTDLESIFTSIGELYLSNLDAKIKIDSILIDISNINSDLISLNIENDILKNTVSILEVKYSELNAKMNYLLNNLSNLTHNNHEQRSNNCVSVHHSGPTNIHTIPQKTFPDCQSVCNQSIVNTQGNTHSIKLVNTGIDKAFEEKVTQQVNNTSIKDNRKYVLVSDSKKQTGIYNLNRTVSDGGQLY